MRDHHIVHFRRALVVSALRQGKIAEIEYLFVLVRLDLRLAVSAGVVGAEPERDHVLVKVFVLFGVSVVETGSLKTEDAALVRLSQDERSVGADGCGAHRPSVAVHGDDVLSQGDQRDGGGVSEESVKIGVVVLESQLQSIGVDGGGAQVVHGDPGVAALDLPGVLQIVEKGRRLAGIVGIEDPLPGVDEVDGLDRSAVAPLRVFERNDDAVSVAVVRLDLVVLHQRLFPLAFGVDAGQPLEEETHDLEHIFVGDAYLRVEVVDLSREIHLDDGAFVVGSVGQLLQRGAPGERRGEHDHRKCK